MIDDAHTRLPLVEGLRRLRVEMHASFRLHANCWRHHESICRAVLALGEADVVRLGPLTRNQILEVIKSRGIEGSNVLLRLLLDQAEGKPGLAVELAEACKRGEVERVWTGEALAELIEVYGIDGLRMPRGSYRD